MIFRLDLAQMPLIIRLDQHWSTLFGRTYVRFLSHCWKMPESPFQICSALFTLFRFMAELNSVENGFCLSVISYNYSFRPAFLNTCRLSAGRSPPLLALNSTISTPTTIESTRYGINWLFALHCQGSDTWRSGLEGTRETIESDN
jgi:hypothetical protein